MKYKFTDRIKWKKIYSTNNNCKKAAITILYQHRFQNKGRCQELPGRTFHNDEG